MTHQLAARGRSLALPPGRIGGLDDLGERLHIETRLHTGVMPTPPERNPLARQLS